LSFNFDLLERVEFKEFQVTEEQSNIGSSGMEINICAFCEQAPTADAKKQCLTNAKCEAGVELPEE